MTLQLSWRLLLPSGFQRGQVQTKVEALEQDSPTTWASISERIGRAEPAP